MRLRQNRSRTPPGADPGSVGYQSSGHQPWRLSPTGGINSRQSGEAASDGLGRRNQTRTGRYSIPYAHEARCSRDNSDHNFSLFQEVSPLARVGLTPVIQLIDRLDVLRKGSFGRGPSGAKTSPPQADIPASSNNVFQKIIFIKDFGRNRIRSLRIHRPSVRGGQRRVVAEELLHAFVNSGFDPRQLTNP